MTLYVENGGILWLILWKQIQTTAKAREWFQKAADQGDVQAKSVLKKLR